MTEVQGVQPGVSSAVSSGGGGDADASRIAEENRVSYVPGEHRFQVVIDGQPTDISPMEAVCLVLQQRYIAMSDITAQKTREMQEQVNQINEANDWLNAIRNAGGDGESFTPPPGASVGLVEWMTDHGLDTTGLTDPLDANGLKKAEGDISNYVDQLCSTNDLMMLSLKTAVNKAQEALTAADGVLQDLKQLMQTIDNNMAR